jgi:hypothetical protein
MIGLVSERRATWRKPNAFHHGMKDSKFSPEDLGALKGSIARVRVHGTKPKM